jgi:hypothetical protein
MRDRGREEVEALGTTFRGAMGGVAEGNPAAP